MAKFKFTFEGEVDIDESNIFVAKLKPDNPTPDDVIRAIKGDSRTLSSWIGNWNLEPCIKAYVDGKEIVF